MPLTTILECVSKRRGLDIKYKYKEMFTVIRDTILNTT